MIKAATITSSMLICLHMGGAACASDVVTDAYDWSGIYAGADIGWSWLDPNTTDSGSIQPDSDGVSGGLYAGYNWQVDNIVLGVEADVQATRLNETDPCGVPTFVCNAGSDWNASLRARIGYAMDRLLVYGTGGYAIGDYEGYTEFVATGIRASDSAEMSGWTAGLGLEYAWTDNIVMRVEYRHLQFGIEPLQYDTDEPYRVKPEIDQIMLGVAWKF